MVVRNRECSDVQDYNTRLKLQHYTQTARQSCTTVRSAFNGPMNPQQVACVCIKVIQ